jgi:hypothetical protein
MAGQVLRFWMQHIAKVMPAWPPATQACAQRMRGLLGTMLGSLPPLR